MEKIITIIKNNPKVTGRQLQALTGLTRRGVEYQLSKLKERKIIKRIGAAKVGHWEVIDKNNR